MGKGKKSRHKDHHYAREAEKYEHPIPSREFILEHLAKRGRPASHKQLLQELELTTDDEDEALRRRLLAMVRDGQLLLNRRGAYGPIDKLELISGYIIGHKDGFGFVVRDKGGDDLYLNAREMRRVFHNDKVLVRVSKMDQRGRSEATIVEVLEHNTQQLVGRYVSESDISYVEPSNPRITQNILIPNKDTKGATQGQMVVVEITSQPSPITRPVGKVIEILGDHMAPGLEIEVAIRNHELPHVWPEAVLNEASRIPAQISKEALQNRLDLRDSFFITIDGEDAKDFDDAVFCKKHAAEGWLLYVAIADVSHYVKPGTSLDQEALNRGNSVYFPGRVIPMLPEVLSNGLCSLNPNVDRLTLACEMLITPAGKISRYRFYETVIRSQARMTYNEVYAMKQNNTAPDHIKDLYHVYEILHKARRARGAIDFDLPETRIIFGPHRKIEKIIPSERNDAHKLIEECMLAANICAARFLLKNDFLSLFRVHEGPTEDKLNDLRRFLSELGLKLPGKKEPIPKDYAELLHSILDRPDAHLIQTVLLRSLSQAIYSPDNKGHFGLAYDAYAHFTSPIRRYPDLLVHRAIRKILRKDFQPGEIDHHLEKQGEHCSMTERRADEATREAVDWLKCEYMMDKVGETFPGVISSVTSFGFFVELKSIYVEGLVHISTLPNDYYHFEPIKHVLVGERSGRRFRLGDVVTVKVARVDLDVREIDFIVAEETESVPKKPKKKKKNLL